MPIGLSPEQFEAAFPFHLAFDADGRLVQAGKVLLRICPRLTVGAPLSDTITIARPHVSFALPQIVENASSLFILRVREPAVTLRGQMLVDSDRQRGLFLGSPWLTRIDEAAALGLSLSDFANHDAVGEYLLLFQTKHMALTDAEALALRLGEQSTALREANERLEAQERRLLEANDALSRSARLKDEFLSNMSHELRTPLNAILGLSESLIEGVYGPVDERQTKALSTNARRRPCRPSRPAAATCSSSSATFSISHASKPAAWTWMSNPSKSRLSARVPWPWSRRRRRESPSH